MWLKNSLRRKAQLKLNWRSRMKSKKKKSRSEIQGKNREVIMIV